MLELNWELKYLIKEQFMRENGLKVNVMELENKFGLMDQYMKDNGLRITVVERENLLMGMVIFMKEIGQKIKQMDLKFINLQMVLNMRDEYLCKNQLSGFMINKKEKVLKNSQMEQIMKVNIMKEERKVMIFFILLMDQNKKGALLIMKYTEMELLNCQMEGVVRVIGKKIKQMEQGKLNGVMVENLLEYYQYRLKELLRRFETWKRIVLVARWQKICGKLGFRQIRMIWCLLYAQLTSQIWDFVGCNEKIMDRE
ncbi:unnamed protein product [Paramecium primaurelia]|uniref:Uncharacterized protein n=1 Tax=Paramecium primaurelia TaxID=5886 RepID=A0A8S1NLW4_PARPR|nr:unnamed protein product [Paramecium primaurelia]